MMCRFVAVSQTVYNASPNQTHVDGIALAVGVATLLNQMDVSYAKVVREWEWG